MDPKLRNKLKKDRKKRSAASKAATSSSPSHADAPPKKTREVVAGGDAADDAFPALDDDALQYEFEEGEEELEQEEAEDEEEMDVQRQDGGGEAIITTLYRGRPAAAAGGGDEAMEHDESAYGMLHRMCFEWPAMSFEFCRDGLGPERVAYPHTVWIVQGTCSGVPEPALNVMRADHLVRTKKTLDEEEEEMMGAIPIPDEDEDDSAANKDPDLEARSFPHEGGINRVRVSPHHPGIVATWGDTGKVHLYDVTRTLSSALKHVGESQPLTQGQGGHFYAFAGHGKREGYALDWSTCKTGRLASGDEAGKVFVWDMDPSRVVVDPVPYTGHGGSVEDVQWSPTEESVFATCSTDGGVKIWDTREPRHQALLSVDRAHAQDVNVISWNRKVPFLLASGSDDCSFKVWDLRAFKADAPVGWFKNFHTGPITSIEWSPHDESVLCVTSEDDQVTLWDLSLEEDVETTAAAAGSGSSSNNNKLTVMDQFNNPVEVPPQLLFVHSGLVNPKEAHFHPHIVGLVGVTGAEGFDLFIPEPLERGGDGGGGGGEEDVEMEQTS